MRAEEIRIRDPFIYLEDGVYYLLGTTGNDCWNQGSNFSLYTSRDLTNFEFSGLLVEKGVLDGYKQLWAPELHKFRGKYYLIVSLFRPDRRRGSMILAADSVRGCGVAVTEQHLLAPRKSTTALLGIADHPVTGTLAGCSTCHLQETCAFRKKGTTCFSQK